MSEANGGRHCDKCQKKVYDFTNSKADKFIKILAENDYKICGRFNLEQMAPLPVLPLWKRWISAAAMILVGVNLFSCKTTNTQTLVGDTVMLSPAEISSQTLIPDSGKYRANTYKSSSNEIVTPIEGLPEFPGGYNKFLAFVNKNLDRSKSAEAGRANITFIVEKDGSLSDVRAIGHIFNQPAIDEAIRAVKLSPKWIPGKQNGKPVKVQYTVPVVFN